MGNAHLQEIYDGNPEIEQLREEIDQLELEPNERLQFMFGYAPYAPTPDDQSGTLLALELDDYAGWIRGLEPENKGEELKVEFFRVMLDLMRASVRSDAEIAFEESSAEIYDSTLQRIEEFDFISFFDEGEQDAAEIVPDMLRMCVHIAAHRDQDDGDDREHLIATYSLLEKYGLNREAVEGFIENCRELAGEYEPGEQLEEMMENQMEEFFAQFDEDDVTRNTLIRMQSNLYNEVIELANSAFAAMVSDSDRLLEFIHDCGESLEKAEKPFFVAA
ncbi:hypothetical protein C5B91_21135, partial [Haloferax sp. Atlit-10N]